MEAHSYSPGQPTILLIDIYGLRAISFPLYTSIVARNTFYHLISDVKIKIIVLYVFSICGLTWWLENTTP
jgi:hypothetical protein